MNIIINHTADRATVASLVCLVGDEKGGVDGLHARRAREAPHEPVVDTLGVVGVHARKVADAVADAELDHTDHAPERGRQHARKRFQLKFRLWSTSIIFI